MDGREKTNFFGLWWMNGMRTDLNSSTINNKLKFFLPSFRGSASHLNNSRWHEKEIKREASEATKAEERVSVMILFPTLRTRTSRSLPSCVFVPVLEIINPPGKRRKRERTTFNKSCWWGMMEPRDDVDDKVPDMKQTAADVYALLMLRTCVSVLTPCNLH